MIYKDKENKPPCDFPELWNVYIMPGNFIFIICAVSKKLYFLSIASHTFTFVRVIG